MDAPRHPEVDYQWPNEWADEAHRITRSLGAVKPAGVSFYIDEALPWVVVWYDEDQIVLPALAVAAGEAIQAATEKSVFFQGLRPSSILYILNDQSLQKGNEPHLGADEYAVPLEQVRKAWGNGASSRV